MTEVLLFHHALGVTPGIREFADELRASGHAVVVPDLYEGRTFDSVAAGVAYAQEVGFDVILERGVSSADSLGEGFVTAGFSLGAMPAQKIAQTHPGVAGAVLYHAAIPIGEFGGVWPDGVALQMHLSEGDELAQEDLPAARDLAAASGGELFLYEGSGHLIVDSSSSDYDPRQAALILERTLEFLSRLG